MYGLEFVALGAEDLQRPALGRQPDLQGGLVAVGGHPCSCFCVSEIMGLIVN